MTQATAISVNVRGNLRELLRGKILDVAIPTTAFIVTGTYAMHNLQQFLRNGNPQEVATGIAIGVGSLATGYLSIRNATIAAGIGRPQRK